MYRTRRLHLEKSLQKPILINKSTQRKSSPKKTNERKISCSKCLEETTQEHIGSDSICYSKCPEETKQDSTILNTISPLKKPKKPKRNSSAQSSTLFRRNFKNKKRNFTDSNASLRSSKLEKANCDSASNYSDKKRLEETNETKTTNCSTLPSKVLEESKTDQPLTSGTKFLKEIKEYSNSCSEITENNTKGSSRNSNNITNYAPKLKTKHMKPRKMDEKQNKLYDKNEGGISRENLSKFGVQSNSKFSKQVGHNISKSNDSRLSDVGDVTKSIRLNQHENMNDQLQPTGSPQKQTTSFDFQDKLKYHDQESYLSQRSHKIGEGLFITDEIEDLPPRFKKQVLKACDKLNAKSQKMEEEQQKMEKARQKIEEDRQKVEKMLKEIQQMKEITATLNSHRTIPASSVKQCFQNGIRKASHETLVENTMMDHKSSGSITDNVLFSKSESPHKNKQMGKSSSKSFENGSLPKHHPQSKVNVGESIKNNDKNKTSFSVKQLPEGEYHSKKLHCDGSESNYTGSDDISVHNANSFGNFRKTANSKFDPKHKTYSKKNRAFLNSSFTNKSLKNDENYSLDGQSSKLDCKYHPVMSASYSTEPKSYKSNCEGHEYKNISNSSIASGNHLVKNSHKQVNSRFNDKYESNENDKNSPVKNSRKQGNSTCNDKHKSNEYDKNSSVKNSRKQGNSAYNDKDKSNDYDKNSADVADLNRIKSGQRNFDNSQTTFKKPKFNGQPFSDKSSSSNSSYGKQYSFNTECTKNTKISSDFANHVKADGRNSAHMQTSKQPFSKFDFQSYPDKKAISSSNSGRNTEDFSKSYLKPLNSNTSTFFSQSNELKSAEDQSIDITSIRKVKDIGFFVHVTVSEDYSNLEMWQIFFKNLLKFDNFDIDTCCKFTESLILSFQCKEDSQKAYHILYSSKNKNKDLRKPHIVSLSRVKNHLLKPCTCKQEIIQNCQNHFKEFSKTYIWQHKNKIANLVDELRSIKSGREDKLNREHRLGLKDALNTLEDMAHVFNRYVEETMFKVGKIIAMSDLRKVKIDFSRECNSFARCLPIYSRKDVILDTVRNHQVSVIVAETGSGKSTQLAEYLLQSIFVDKGTIICTQPRKVAAISITQFVSGQIGSAVGKEIGYDVGIEKKYLPTTKIIYMTDYALLRKCLQNKRLKGVSCIIIDEAHERTLYTDLLLGLLKQCFPSRPDLRVVITSATIDPSVFVDYFNLPSSAVVNVPGRAYPVKVIWLKDDVDDNFKYVEECVKTAVEVHLHESKGDILVFLTSPAEIDEAILLFKENCYEEDMPQLMSLHGKSDIHEQMLVFQTDSNKTRRIIFATNSAETSLTIPGIKYVIDSGMTKEMLFYPEKNKSCLIPKLINKSSAEQRKGRAGRTQPGVCFRLYSKKNYENMPERSLPEILKTNLLSALMKVYEFSIKPDEFDFVESPSKEAIARSLDSLEMLDLVKDDKLTKLGRQVVQLSIEPRLAKFVLSGVECGIGHEAAIIASLVSEAGRLFIRFDDNKIAADERKKVFCQENGDLCTFLEIYKRWLEVSKSERFDWCVSNYISSKALTSASKTVKEIIMSLRLDLDITVSRRYNNLSFKTNFERILFNSFSENLCIFSGHPSVGYFSPHFKESLFIHPSSSLKHLHKACPKFLVYTTLMETSRNFILDVTPLKEETISKAYLSGKFTLTIDTMMKLQILPLVLGPFGEKMLSRHIIGKGGAVINNLEHLIERITKTKNFRLDINRDKGQIIVYIENRFHDKISKFFQEIVDQALIVMAKEEKVIKMKEGSSYFCLSTGGLIHDIIMPGEFRNLIIQIFDQKQLEEIKALLENIGILQSFNYPSNLKKENFFVNATYRRVSEAQQAFDILQKNKFKVRPERENQKRSLTTKPLYKLKLSWVRILCKGTGCISFSSEEDCIIVCGKLTMTSISIENKIIAIRPSNNRQTELEVKNLPPLADERILKEKLIESLPPFLSKLIKEVHVDRMKSQSAVESDTANIRDQLMKIFCRFTSSNKLLVDVKHPRPSDDTWEAWAYFENCEDGKQALQQLKGNIKLNSVPVQLVEVLESEILTKNFVYQFLQNNIHNLILEQGGKLIKNQLHYNKEDILLKFSCQTLENLCSTREKLLKLIEGRKIECIGNRKYFYLFTETGKTQLMEVGKITNTLITSNTTSKAISIYGSQENCYQAKTKIHAFIETSRISKTKVFDLKNSQMPSGFLRRLYETYGMDLFNLIKKFDLMEARIDSVNGRLIIKGQNSAIKMVEDHLENICIDLYKKNPNKSLQDDAENCAICLDPINFDFYRLENCGHAFCKLCLVLQIESKIIPVLCAHENCGKQFLLIDIEKIFSFGGAKLKEDFLNAALQYHIKINPGKVSYCPTPDCLSVYRVSNKSDSEFPCPGCETDICTHCQTYSHKGMSCDMFKNTKIDEDYSLKVWMKADTSRRKMCPKCRTAIEKIEGCNHMECLNCQAHLCWLCLQVFSSGELVYKHLPYCPKNQGN